LVCRFNSYGFIVWRGGPMTNYDLREYRGLPWVRFMFWFRVGIAVFLLAALAWIISGVYQEAVGARLGTLQAIEFALIFGVLGTMTFMVTAMRGSAVNLTIDEWGVRLDYARGPVFSRSWTAEGVVFRGRYTRGVRDSISHGRALWSVYGRGGGFAESFIPESAYNELVSVAVAHGLRLTETNGHPGWTLYQIG
jgi:hypothetical protein